MTIATASRLRADTTASADDFLLEISGGNTMTWDGILRRYGKLVSAIVRSFRLQDADTLDAIQMTWLRLAENAHSIQFPERLGGWLATTARRECLHILCQAKHTPDLIDVLSETLADSSEGPEQHVIDVDTKRTLLKLVDELSPRRQMLLRMLFADESLPYAEVSRVSGIPLGGIGPTRTRALRQLQAKLNEYELRR